MWYKAVLLGAINEYRTTSFADKGDTIIYKDYSAHTHSHSCAAIHSFPLPFDQRQSTDGPPFLFLLQHTQTTLKKIKV